MNDRYDVSIVIPTKNRSRLLAVLLKSLKVDRDAYVHGSTEVIVVDNSEEDEKENIIKACQNYNAVYYSGDASVRKKRNFGIKTAQYPYILFLDSDVTAEPGLILSHMETFRDFGDPKLGGALGYTEFVGKKSFCWRALEHTRLIDSFSFARKYPFQSWTIGNNVSFRKDVLLKIGMFEENFPFMLGGDDLDMSYRVTKAGYLIKSCPNAVTYHARETWNSPVAVHNRAKRWGTMEYFICLRHPEIYQSVMPRGYLINLFAILIAGIASFFSISFTPLVAGAVFAILHIIAAYILDMALCGSLQNPLFYFLGKSVQLHYERYRLWSFFKHGRFNALFKGMIFNRTQIRYGLSNESLRMWIALICVCAAMLLTRVWIMLGGAWA